MSNHFDTMVQRGPDNVDGSKYTSEVRFFDQLYWLLFNEIGIMELGSNNALDDRLD